MRNCFFLLIEMILACVAEAAEPNLVGWWKLDEGSGPIVTDSVSDNDGTITGAVWVEGQKGFALEFDSINDYVSLTRNAVTTTEFTVTAWANQYGEGGGSNRQNIIFQQRDDTGGENHCAIVLGTENIDDLAFATIRSSIGSSQTLKYTSMAYNQWHYYTMTVDSNDFVFYIDVVEVGRVSNSQMGDYVTSIDYVDIGRHQYNEGIRGCFNGVIDDFRVYDRVLSVPEILQIYRDALGSRASSPNPGDEAIGVDPDAVLSWQWGDYAVSHDVYFGTSYSDVNDAVSNFLAGDVNSNGQVDWYDVSILNSQWLDDTCGLEPSADVDGDGDVNFVDFAIISNQWKEYSIYRGDQDTNSYDPDELKIGKSYYWRIDEVNDSNVWKGQTWNFTVKPRIAYSPSPADDVNAFVRPDNSLTLSWSSGFGANSHDVYLGTDYNDVNDANTLTLGVFKGNQSTNSYGPFSPGLDTKYYWRIDEVNGTDVWKGDVWSFIAVRGVELGVMSFNILNDEGIPSSDPDAWICTSGTDRKDRVIAMILTESVAFGSDGPDILGVQEALNNQVNDLQSAMSNYDFYGVGRNDGETEGEYAGIFYRSSRFSRTDQGTFWLSYEPDEPGSKFPGSHINVRIASWAILYDNMTEQSYFVLNTHWENDSQEARQWSAELIRERVKLYAGDLPVIITGDLNCHEDDEEFLELIGENDPLGFQLFDSYREIFPGGPDSRIDFVLHTGYFEAMEATIETAKIYGRYPSDHRPVTATFYIQATGGGG